MTMPQPRQTVHLMTNFDVLRTCWKLHNEEGRTSRELALYTTDDLRRLYQGSTEQSIRLRDGIVGRVELVAVIRWRIFWQRFGYVSLLGLSVASTCFALLAWRDPITPPPAPAIAGLTSTPP